MTLKTIVRHGSTREPGGMLVLGSEIVRCGQGRQSPESDHIFFTHLAAGFGVRHSAAAAGFSTTAL